MLDVARETLLTLDEAAKILKVTKRTVGRWCKSGKLRAVYFGGVLRTSVEAVQEMQRPASSVSDTTAKAGKAKVKQQGQQRRADDDAKRLRERHGIEIGDRKSGSE